MSPLLVRESMQMLHSLSQLALSQRIPSQRVNYFMTSEQNPLPLANKVCNLEYANTVFRTNILINVVSWSKYL